MKKHIFGIALFSLIVGTAVLIGLLSVTPPDSASIVVRDNYVNKTKNSCFRVKRKPVESGPRQVFDSSKLKIKQAVLNWNNKGIDWEIYVPETEASVALHLFAKNQQGVRYVATEIVPLKSSSYNQMIRYSTVYISLNNFTPDESLYAVPEMISVDDAQTQNFYPRFNEKSVTPVMINLEKGYPASK